MNKGSVYANFISRMRKDLVERTKIRLKLPPGSQESGVPPVEAAEKLLRSSGAAHVLYEVLYCGKPWNPGRHRNRSRVYMSLHSDELEVYMDDESFERRADFLYQNGCTWIGALHK